MTCQTLETATISTLVGAMLCAGAAGAGAQAPAEAPPAPVPGAVVGEPAHDLVKGAGLLAELRNKLGGEAQFAAVQTLEMTGQSGRAMGNGVVEGDFEFRISQPDKFRRNESLTISGGALGISIVQVLNGPDVLDESSLDGSAVSQLGGGRNRGGIGNIASLLSGGFQIPANATPEERQEAQRRSVATEMERLLMAVLLTSPAPVAWIGMAESSDGMRDVLEFHTPDDVATRLLVDSETRMPRMMTWTGVAPQLGNFDRGGRSDAAAPTAITMYLSDYKTVDGLKLPHLIQRGPNRETTEEFAVKSYRINEKFDDDVFDATP
jgi:hypothetical protein